MTLESLSTFDIESFDKQYNLSDTFGKFVRPPNTYNKAIMPVC